MVDTVRTLSALQTLLANNTAGDISAQDVRDFLVSVFPPQYAGARVSDPSGAAQSLTGGAHNLVTFDTENWDEGGYANLGANADRLTIPAGYGGLHLIIGQVVFAADDSKYFQVTLLKNGTAGTVLGLGIGEISVNSQRLMSVAALDIGVATDYYSVSAIPESNSTAVHSAAGPHLTVARLGQPPA